MRHNTGRWRSPFPRWVREYGSRRLASQLGVTQLAVYHWVAGRCAPRPEHALGIVRLSRQRLRLDDVYAARRCHVQPAAPPRSAAPTKTEPAAAGKA